MKVVVIGGTGLIGSKTVAILRQRGHEVVAASPNPGVNTLTGQGLKETLAGEGVDAGVWRGRDDFVAALSQDGDGLRADQAGAADDDDLHGCDLRCR